MALFQCAMHTGKMFIHTGISVQEKPANVTRSLFLPVTLNHMIIVFFLCFKCFTALGIFAYEISLFWKMGSLSVP